MSSKKHEFMLISSQYFGTPLSMNVFPGGI